MNHQNSHLFIGLSGIISLNIFSGCSGSKNEQKQIYHPNIIFILADDMGYGDLGCYGQKLIKTPNLDLMAAKGIRFTQHYSGTSVSAPSRCCLMTGLHCGHAYVRGNKEADPYGQLPLPDTIATVAELLKKAGYQTGMIGKWGLGVENTSGDPAKHGFDFFYGYYCQLLAHNSFPAFLYRNGVKENLSNEVVWTSKNDWTRGNGSVATKRVTFSNDLFCNEAITFINNHQKNPFFLYLPFTIPHDNDEAPEGHRNEVPSLGIYENENWTPDEKAYAAMITRLDSYVGTILSKLKELKLDSNTLVIFSSDNGAENKNVFNSNGGLRGKKRDLFEGGLREPLIAYWPGKIKSSSVSDHISAFWDFMPTACELAGTEIPKNTDGISYVNALLGKEQKKHKFLYWEIMDGVWGGKGPKQAIRMDNWKAVIPDAGNESDTIQLFDLTTDLFETNNIAAQHPEILNDMKDIFSKEHVASKEFPLKREMLKKN